MSNINNHNSTWAISVFVEGAGYQEIRKY